MCFIQNPKNRLRLNLLCVYLVILCAWLLSPTAFAQTGTIGTVTSTSSLYPFRASSAYSYSQQIYTATELNEAGVFGPGMIQSIAFYCNSADVVTTNFNAIDVFMGNTAQSTFASASGWIPISALTNVGAWNLPAVTTVGWITYSLATPFFWDGTSNLVIAIDENVPNFGSSLIWKVFSGGTAASGNESLTLIYWDNSINPDPSAPPTAISSSSTTRNQLQLTISSNCGNISNLPVYNNVIAGAGICNSQTLLTNPNFNSYQWKRDNVSIPGTQSSSYVIPADPDAGLHSYVCEAYCEANGQTIVSNSIDVQTQNCIADYSSPINYMLVQNVTTTGVNSSNQTAQVQFDLNWGYSWKDSINWDAAWVFIKYKNAAGEWKPCKIRTTGYDHGQGTPNNIDVPSDQMGAFVSMSQYGNANVDIQGLQLQWDYGADGISNPGMLEVKVFAVEMVYVPQGDFNCFSKFQNLTINAPGNNYLVVNDRLSPTISWTKTGSTGTGSVRIKGDVGLDNNGDGTVESVNYPTGFTPFYMCKYEMSEQQYADFLNCMTSTQRATLGVAGSTITSVSGIRYASSPNLACIGFTKDRFLSYADWSGLRPMSILEYAKSAQGPYNIPLAPSSPTSGDYGTSSQVYVPKKASYPLGGNFQDSVTPKNVGEGDSNNSQAYNSGTGYYGAKDLGGNLTETVVGFSSSFSKLTHGDGVLNSTGLHNVSNWNALVVGSNLFEIEPNRFTDTVYFWNTRGQGFRFARTAE